MPHTPTRNTNHSNIISTNDPARIFNNENASIRQKIFLTIKYAGVNVLCINIFKSLLNRVAILKRIIKKLNILVFSESTLEPKISTPDLFSNLSHQGIDLGPSIFPTKKTYLLTDCKVTPILQKKLGPVITNLDNLSNLDISNGVFYIYFECDSDALPLLREIKENGGTYIPHLDASKTSYRFINRLALDAMKLTWAKAKRVSHLNNVVHENICEALWITRYLEGDYIEIGVYLGGSALTAINYLDIEKQSNIQSYDRKVWLLDTYDGFNYDAAYKSADAMWANTHTLLGIEKTISHIAETLSHTKTCHQLIVSNICTDDLPKEIQKIAVANIDVDMYEPTLASLNKLSDLIVPGGIIICEDPASTPALYGALLAMEEFLLAEKGRSYIKIFKGGQYFLIKRFS